MKYFIFTYGCQMNISDSERIASLLKNSGYKQALNETKADLIVVNMCSVRQSAVDRIHGVGLKLKQLKKRRKNLKTILTGCILRKDRNKFRKYFDFILNIQDLPNWHNYLISFKAQSKSYDAYYLNIKPERLNEFSALIPISNGCNNLCSYCVVPFTRGPLICRSHKQILKEVKSAIKKGFKEIWLLGQNVNDYQSPIDASVDSAKLLKLVNDIDNHFWLRFTSPNPKDFSIKLINSMAKCEKFTQYLNLPVQSGDDEILKKMNRPYTAKNYKNLVKKIREKMPDIALSTDVILGFPTETKKKFQNTVKLFKDIKFDMAYIAQYSPRAGTKAIDLKDSVSKKEKKRRWKILTEILKKIAFEKNKEYIGKTREVLIEKYKNGFLLGKTRTHKTIKIPEYSKLRAKKLVGQFVKAKIINASAWGLKGELIKKLPKLIVILGSTATGKTGIAIKLAKQFNGEIISADSRQIYKEMAIGTAKPSKKEIKAVPHHLVDFIRPDKNFNVVLYKKRALKAIQKINKKGKIPFLVGGTGLYIKALVDNLSFPEVPPQKKLRKELEKKEIKELFKIYKKLDAHGAKFIDKKNKRRLVRAIEVCKATKKPFWQQRKKQESIFNVIQIGIKLSKKELEKRISKRTDEMFKFGLEKEVKRLNKKYSKSPLLQTIGYQEWFENKNKKEIKEDIKMHTMQFAKRQMTWFKKDKRINWTRNYKKAKRLVENFLISKTY